jgi:hypothetical protein
VSQVPINSVAEKAVDKIEDIENRAGCLIIEGSIQLLNFKRSTPHDQPAAFAPYNISKKGSIPSGFPKITYPNFG